MKRDNIITFDELLEYATEYFKSLGAKVEHLLVDELQDIDTREYDFIKALNSDHYFFVGDDWQAIYGFKGGNVGIFKNLSKNKNYTKYYLTNNYRNCSKIVKMGLSVIMQVKDVIEKDVNICNESSEGLVTVQSKAKQDKIVELLTNDKDNWCDWFVLTRTNKEAYALGDLLDDNDIDYTFIRKSDLTLEELQEAMRDNKVKILTVHSAKGLENKKVILYGSFPLVQPSYFRNSDERKVMYVGVTRASDELHIFN
jgi:superfamily I DNA/RNA helicase